MGSLVIRPGFNLLGPAIGLISYGLTLSFALVFAGLLLLILPIITGCRLIFPMREFYRS
jgi:hypothetical protein